MRFMQICCTAVLYTTLYKHSFCNKIYISESRVSKIYPLVLLLTVLSLRLHITPHFCTFRGSDSVSTYAVIPTENRCLLLSIYYVYLAWHWKRHRSGNLIPAIPGIGLSAFKTFLLIKARNNKINSTLKVNWKCIFNHASTLKNKDFVVRKRLSLSIHLENNAPPNYSWFVVIDGIALNPYLPSGIFHPYQLDESISIFRGGWCTFSFLFYFE